MSSGSTSYTVGPSATAMSLSLRLGVRAENVRFEAFERRFSRRLGGVWVVKRMAWPWPWAPRAGGLGWRPMSAALR